MVEFELTADASALRPLSPVRVRARRRADDIAIDWIRRTRIGGDSWEVAEVPLGEETERYRLRIFAGETIVREEICSAPFFPYPEADETADFGVPQGSLSLGVAQISAVAGLGSERRGTVPVQP